MNESNPYLAILSRLLNTTRSRSGTAKPSIHIRKGVGLSSSKTLAAAATALVFSGCPPTEGVGWNGPSSAAAVQSARTSQNIVAQENARAAMNAQIIQDRRSLRMEEAAEARRNVQQANQQVEAQRRMADATRDAKRQAEIQQQQRIAQQRDTGGGGSPNNGRGNQGQGNNGQGNQGQGQGQGRQ
jgi:hypothetical protein